MAADGGTRATRAVSPQHPFADGTRRPVHRVRVATVLPGRGGPIAPCRAGPRHRTGSTPPQWDPEADPTTR